MDFPEAPQDILEQLRKERTQEKCSKCPHWGKPSDEKDNTEIARVINPWVVDARALRRPWSWLTTSERAEASMERASPVVTL